MHSNVKAVIWGFAVALYGRFGLEATGWLFYQASHALSVDWLYWGYSTFRAAGHFLSLWQYQNITCIGIGALITMLIMLRAKTQSTGAKSQ